MSSLSHDRTMKVTGVSGKENIEPDSTANKQASTSATEDFGAYKHTANPEYFARLKTHHKYVQDEGRIVCELEPQTLIEVLEEGMKGRDSVCKIRFKGGEGWVSKHNLETANNSALPPGWEAHISQTTGDVYYCDLARQTTTLDKPAELKPLEKVSLSTFEKVRIADNYYMADPCYMDEQEELTPDIRMIVVGWLTALFLQYDVKCLTLFWTVNLMDRFLCKATVSRKYLQLVGTACFFIITKQREHVGGPFVNLKSQCPHSEEEILAVEARILTALGGDLGKPVIAHIFGHLKKYVSDKRGKATGKDLVHYFLTLAMQDYRMLRYSSLHLVAAAIYACNKFLQCEEPWPSAACQETKLTSSILTPCVDDMCQLHQDRFCGKYWTSGLSEFFNLSERITTTLKVDSTGAGVFLDPRHGGMLIKEVSDVPGQRNLLANDLIVQVNGRSLRTMAWQGVADKFRAHFGNGVKITVIRESKEHN